MSQSSPETFAGGKIHFRNISEENINKILQSEITSKIHAR